MSLSDTIFIQIEAAPTWTHHNVGVAMIISGCSTARSETGSRQPQLKLYGTAYFFKYNPVFHPPLVLISPQPKLIKAALE